eukprot:432245_1
MSLLTRNPLIRSRGQRRCLRHSVIDKNLHIQLGDCDDDDENSHIISKTQKNKYLKLSSPMVQQHIEHNSESESLNNALNSTIDVRIKSENDENVNSDQRTSLICYQNVSTELETKEKTDGADIIELTVGPQSKEQNRTVPTLVQSSSTFGVENVEIFKHNKTVDKKAAIILCIICVSTLASIYAFGENNRNGYCIVAAVYFIISASMSISLNSSDIAPQTVIIVLSVLYALFGAILICLSIISSISIISFSTYFGLTSFISSWWIVFVLSIFQCAGNKQDTKNPITILKLSWKMKSLIIPVTAHIADLSSDIAACYEYYERADTAVIHQYITEEGFWKGSQRYITAENKNEIPYYSIFWMSIFIMFFYRFISSLIIWKYTRSKSAAVLQFLELYLFKQLRTEWKLGYIETGRFHQTLDILESIFESGPEAIISFYIMYADHNKSIIIWMSSVMSIAMIASKSKTQDNRYFTQESGAKEARFSWPYLLRVVWRIADITVYILFCAVFWDHFGGLWIISFLGVQLIVVLIIMSSNTFCCGIGINFFFLNALLATALNPWISVTFLDVGMWGFAVTRAVINVVVACIIYIQLKNEISLIILSSFCISFILWTAFVGRQGFCCLRYHFCGTNWTQMGTVTTLNLSSCHNLTEIQDLMKEGVYLGQYIKDYDTWRLYPRPNELVRLAKKHEWNLSTKKGNYFVRLGWNKRLDKNTNANDIEETIVYLKKFCDINERGTSGRTAIELAAEWHCNTTWMQSFIKNGATFDPNKCLERAKLNKTGEKETIIQFFAQAKGNVFNVSTDDDIYETDDVTEGSCTNLHNVLIEADIHEYKYKD